MISKVVIKLANLVARKLIVEGNSIILKNAMSRASSAITKIVVVAATVPSGFVTTVDGLMVRTSEADQAGE